MRHTLAIAVCLPLLVVACGSADEDTTGASTTIPAVAPATAEVTVRSTTSTSTTATVATSTTTTSIPPEAVAGPDYVVTGPEGVFRWWTGWRLWCWIGPM